MSLPVLEVKLHVISVFKLTRRCPIDKRQVQEFFIYFTLQCSKLGIIRKARL